MARAVLSRFVSEIEYPDAYARKLMAGLVAKAEVNILTSLPVLSLIDSNLHSTVENKLWELMDDSKLKYMAVLAILSTFSFYYNLCVATSSDSEVIEELHDMYGIDSVALGFIAIGAASISAMHTFDAIDVPSKDLKFDARAIKAAMRLSSIAVRKDIDRPCLSHAAVRLQALTARSTILHAHAVIQAAFTKLEQ